MSGFGASPATRRATLPRGRLPNAFAAPSLSLNAGAVRFDTEPDRLFAAAEAALLPPWTAFKPGSVPRLHAAGDKRARWRFAAAATPAEVERHMTAGVLWLHRLHPDDSDVTAAWAADTDSGPVDVAQIAEWCRCAPHPLHADHGVFAVWCADHDDSPMLTAHRLQTLRRWFEMLRAEGAPEVADRHPAEGVHLEVVAAGNAMP